MAAGRKRRPKAGARDGAELGGSRTEAGELPILGAEGRPEEAGVVGPEGDGDAGPKKRQDRVPRERKRAGRVVRGETDVEGDARAREAADEGGIGRGRDAVGDPPGPQPAERVGDGVGAAGLAGVDDGRQAEAGEPAVDGSEVARGQRELVAAEAESDDARPGAPGVRVEDPVGGVGAEVADGVEEDPDPAPARALVGREDRLDRVADFAPVEAEALHDAGGDVDLGVRDPLPGEARRQVARQESEVVRPAQEPADVAVEREEPGQPVERPPGADGGRVGEERGAGAAGQPDESGGADRPFQVQVEVGEGAGRREGGHAARSYGTGAVTVSSRVASERLWLRAAAFGLDLICLAGGPLLLATVTVFLVVLLAAEPPAGLPYVYRAAQVVFVVLFLLRDALGASPGKRLLGLTVVRTDGRPLRPVDSLVRNLSLLVPLLNFWEAAAVVRRPDARRLGDRLAGTAVGES